MNKIHSPRYLQISPLYFQQFYVDIIERRNNTPIVFSLNNGIFNILNDVYKFLR